MSLRKMVALVLALLLLFSFAPTGLFAEETPAAEGELDETQRNSINMLNYLVVLTQEINASQNSRLYLEETYSALQNNTNPNAVDSRTLVEINYLFDTLEEYRMIAVKRDRLQYIYEQNRARAIRDALPGPLALLNVNEAPDKARLISSVVFMVLDAGLNYADSVEEVELQYLQDGWALDDEQAATLHEIRKGTFNYMVETVRDYDLPGELALTEQAVADYVEWENNSNDLQVIRFFEDNEATYRAFGPYWLALARRYYNVGDYAACLRAFDAYEQLDMDIFRRDYDLAQALPLAIVAARNVQDDAQYAQTAARYVRSILDNTDHDDWALRYFAAQTCVELCALTDDESYLQQAYDIALSNVNDLVTQQRAANAAYLAEVKKAEAPQGATEAQKKDVEDYNKLLTEERKAELPPTDEALLLNCDLLFALADELGVSDAQRQSIDGILHEDGAPLFLVPPLDSLYWMTGEAQEAPAESIDIGYGRSTVTVPAQYVTDEAAIAVTVTTEDGSVTFEDWTLQKVERKDKDDLASFIATYKSSAAGAHGYAVGSRIHIEITPRAGSETPAYTAEYEVVRTKKLLVFDDIGFRKVS